ncbi:MAG: DUF2304 domain-containing protein [Candidatus Micrarchaeota archaeon]
MVELIAVQVGTMIIGLFFVYHAYLQKRRSIFGSPDLAFWLIVWGGLTVLSLISAFFIPLTTTVIGTYRAIDFLVVAAIIILFSLQYLLYSRMRALETRFRQLVKNTAFGSGGKRKRKTTP